MSTQNVLVKTGFRVILIYGMVISGAFQPKYACSQLVEHSSPEIESLIGDLEHESFRTRESAERNLIRIGVPAARLLAMEAIEGTPESAMRSARILQEIGVQSKTESDMLRLACAMDYLANHGFPHFQDAASQIASRWKKQQARIIRTKIRELGIQIPEVDEDDSFDQGGLGFLVINNGIAPESEADVETPTMRATLRPENKVLVARMDEIFDADEPTILKYMNDVMINETVEPSVVFPNAGVHQQVIINGRIQQGRFFDEPGATISSIDEGTLKGIELMRLLPSVPQISISDSEIPHEVVAAIANVPGLQVISLSRCQYNPGTVLKMLESRPGISIDATGHDAFLGVSVEAGVIEDELEETKKVCTVLTVVPNSAAEGAGIQVGDHILELDGFAVSEFNHLIVCIASHRVGDDIAIKYQSQDEVFEKTIKLGKRPALD